MQLLHLAIPRFRNLRDLAMDFATHLPPGQGAVADARRKPIRSHALIGQNGTGKSNLIEALITIFRDIDLDRGAAFDYTLAYTIRDRRVRIQADTAKQKRPFVWVDNQAASQGHLLQHRELLPSHIFAYYSGRNERIEGLFQEHQRRFNFSRSSQPRRSSAKRRWPRYTSGASSTPRRPRDSAPRLRAAR